MSLFKVSFRVQKLDCKYKKYYRKLLNPNIKCLSEGNKQTSDEDKSIDLGLKQQILENIKQSHIFPYLSDSFNRFLGVHFVKKKNYKSTYCFVANSEVARKIASNIIKDKEETGCIYIEGNPGFGFITYELLTQQNSKVHVYDTKKNLNLVLTQLEQKFPEKIVLHGKNIFSRIILPYTYILIDDPKKVIGVFKSASYFSLLSMLFTKIPLQKSLTNSTFYCIVPSYILDGVQEFLRGIRISYETYCIINLFFDISVMDRYNKKDFLPLTPGETYEDMLLLKVKLKENCELNINSSDLSCFLDLVKILRRSRYLYIIPLLDQIIPGCGLYLISEGLSMTMQVKDLKASEAVTLFRLLKKDNIHFQMSEYVRSGCL